MHYLEAELDHMEATALRKNLNSWGKACLRS